jgi:predicted DNA binding CopG/RHH family protein
LPLPSLRSDEEAEDFVANADLTKYDLSGFKPYHFEFEAKEATLQVRLPESLLKAFKDKAKERKMPYSRFLRMVMEAAVKS